MRASRVSGSTPLRSLLYRRVLQPDHACTTSDLGKHQGILQVAVSSGAKRAWAGLDCLPQSIECPQPGGNAVQFAPVGDTSLLHCSRLSMATCTTTGPSAS